MEELLTFIMGSTPLETFARAFVFLLLFSLLKWIVDGVRGV